MKKYKLYLPVFKINILNYDLTKETFEIQTNTKKRAKSMLCSFLKKKYNRRNFIILK